MLVGILAAYMRHVIVLDLWSFPMIYRELPRPHLLIFPMDLISDDASEQLCTQLFTVEDFEGLDIVRKLRLIHAAKEFELEAAFLYRRDRGKKFWRANVKTLEAVVKAKVSGTDEDDGDVSLVPLYPGSKVYFAPIGQEAILDPGAQLQTEDLNAVIPASHPEADPGLDNSPDLSLPTLSLLKARAVLLVLVTMTMAGVAERMITGKSIDAGVLASKGVCFLVPCWLLLPRPRRFTGQG